MFKDTKEGETHSYNDGCGEPAHNPKLPQHIEKRFDERFSPEWWTSFGTTPDIDKHGIEGIKSFIATILEEERERIIARFKDEWLGDDYHGEAIEKIIREMNIINLIKEDDK